MPEETNLSKKKRGGQPGNNNALKHGFYASRFTPTDRQDLEDYDFTGLVDEVILLRVYIRRIIEQSANLTKLEDSLTVLRALSIASTTITRLLRTQRLDLTPMEKRSYYTSNRLFSEALAAVMARRESDAEDQDSSTPS